MEGLYAAPRGMLNLSTVMTEADLQRVSDAYRRAFGYLALTRSDERRSAAKLGASPHGERA